MLWYQIKCPSILFPSIKVNWYTFFWSIMSTYLHLKYPSKMKFLGSSRLPQKNVKFTPARAHPPSTPTKTQREHHLVKLRSAFREPFFYYEPALKCVLFLLLRKLAFGSAPCGRCWLFSSPSGPSGFTTSGPSKKPRGIPLTAWRIQVARRIMTGLGGLDSRHPNGSRKGKGTK